MMVRSGFLLSEVLVYLFILLFLMSIIMRHGVSSLSQLGVQSSYAQQIIQVHSVQARFMRDIETTYAGRRYWLYHDATSLIWHTDKQDIGWFIMDGKVLRRAGTYNAKKGAWHTKKTSLAATAISKGTFDILWMNCAGHIAQVSCITLDLEVKMPNSSMKSFFCICRPRNREL
jgi:hypothetical protein